MSKSAEFDLLEKGGYLMLDILKRSSIGEFLSDSTITRFLDRHHLVSNKICSDSSSYEYSSEFKDLYPLTAKSCFSQIVLTGGS